MRLARLLCLAPFALWAGASFAQDKPKPDDKFRPEAPTKDEEEDLTPEKALQMLKEVNELQELAAELLNATAQGKALETEQELLDRLKKLLRDEERVDPQTAQKKILEKIERLMGKSEGSQKDAADKMGEIIRRAKQGQGKPGEPKPGEPRQPQQQPPSQRALQPSDPAKFPYDPGRNSDPINKFRSIPERNARWGDLPARVRESILSSKRDLDDYPPEFQQLLKEYFEKMLNDK